jgi:hypothetical protein
MDDPAYRAMVSRFGEGDRHVVVDELRAEAQRRGDRRVLAAIDLRSGPSAKEARAAGDLLALGRAIAGRAGLWRTWGPLVEEVSRWPDDEASRAAVASLSQALDALELDSLREAPAAWWNAAQRGAAPVGWPLVRRLIFRERLEPEDLLPCADAESLAALTIIDADEHHLAPDKLAGARRLRTLIYQFSSTLDRRSDPVEALAALAGTLEQLAVTVNHAATELSSLRALSALTDLRVHFRFDDLGGHDPLAALGGMALSALRVDSRSALPSLAVLDALPALRVLHVDRAPADPAPIGRPAQLEELLLGRAATLPPLPSSLTSLHLIESDGLRSSDQLSSLAKLEILLLTDCRAVDELRLGGLTALRELAISGAPPDAAGAARLGLLDLGEAPHLEELRLDALPALREIRLAGPRPPSLRVVSLERCPALLAVPAALAGSET